MAIAAITRTASASPPSLSPRSLLSASFYGTDRPSLTFGNTNVPFSLPEGMRSITIRPTVTPEDRSSETTAAVREGHKPHAALATRPFTILEVETITQTQ